MLFHFFVQDAMGAEATRKQTSINNNGNNTLLKYENSTYGIKILYPHDWNKEENVGGGNYSENSSLTDVVRFSPPFENNSSDKSSENLDVKVDDVSDIQPVSLAKYTNDTIEDLGKDFKIISLDTNASIGSNNPAYKIVYTGIEQDANLQAI